MDVKIFDGRSMALGLYSDLKSKLSEHAALRKPRLDVIYIGANPASERYIGMKEKAASDLGFEFNVHKFASDVDQSAVYEMIERLNADENVDGIMVQLPLPVGFEYSVCVDTIAPSKDVDGLTATNLGKVFNGANGFLSATAKAIVTIIESEIADLKGKDIVIVNNSNVIGLPLLAYLNLAGATVMICHKDTVDLASKCRQAEVLITATGVAGLIGSGHVRKGAVVVDAGVSVKDGKVYGDIDFDEVCEVASYVTPATGGVGPMTVASLMVNTYEAWSRKML